MSYKQDIHKSFCRKTAHENKQDINKDTQHCRYLIYIWSDNAFKGTVVNPVLSSSEEGAH